ncbi:hypothetical protein PQR39_26285 [Paraburkholderia sediminicola]|uniref:hypothetical protein n=1 Tax=Paraburkholderia sediminicola TaxID=458836 RepID=UPI0038B8A69F
MDLHGFQPYRGYFYQVSANHSPVGEWRGTIDVRRHNPDGTVEAVISHRDVPGEFTSEDLARSAADAYARLLIDDDKFSDA